MTYRKLPVIAVVACTLGAAPMLHAQDEPATAVVSGSLAEEIQIRAQILKEATAIIDSIQSKEDADAAVPKLKGIYEETERFFSSLNDDDLAKAHPEAIMATLQFLAHYTWLGYKHDFYGSTALASLFPQDEEDTPAPEPDAASITPEQKALCDAKLDDNVSALVQFIDILSEVKDKESADAAAVKLAELRERQPVGRVEWEDDSPAVQAYVSVKMDKARALLGESLVAGLLLADLNFYDSEALLKVFAGSGQETNEDGEGE